MPSTCVEDSSLKAHPDFSPLVSFLKDRYEPASSWEDQAISDYLEWGAQNDFLFVARNDDDSVAGVALARPISCFPETLHEFDPDGDRAHINFLVADSNKAFALLGFTILNHYSGCTRITFQRYKNGKAYKKSYPYDQVRRTLFNLRNHHGQKRK